MRKKSAAELLVEEKDELSRKITTYRSWMAHMRVTRNPLADVDEGVRRRMIFRDEPWREEFPISNDVVNAFYRFVGDEAYRMESRKLEIERKLDAMSASNSAS